MIAQTLSLLLLAGAQGRHDTKIAERNEHREPFVGATVARPITNRIALTGTAIYTVKDRQTIYSVGVAVKLK